MATYHLKKFKNLFGYVNCFTYICIESLKIKDMTDLSITDDKILKRVKSATRRIMRSATLYTTNS